MVNKTEIGSSRPCQRPNRRRRRVTRKLDCEDLKIQSCQSFPFITFVDTPSEACRQRVSLRAPNSKYQSKTSKCLRHIEKPVNRSDGSCRRMEGDSLVTKWIKREYRNEVTQVSAGSVGRARIQWILWSFLGPRERWRWN